MMEYDIHTLLDLLTLGASLYAIYIVRFPLKATYQADLDSINLLVVVRPSPAQPRTRLFRTRAQPACLRARFCWL